MPRPQDRVPKFDEYEERHEIAVQCLEICASLHRVIAKIRALESGDPLLREMSFKLVYASQMSLHGAAKGGRHGHRLSICGDFNK